MTGLNLNHGALMPVTHTTDGQTGFYAFTHRVWSMAIESPLAGQTALVTGASAGIGRATARALAAEGAAVVLAARREPELRSVATSIEDDFGVESRAVPTDVTNYSRVESVVDEAIDAFGQLDVVVSNAGTGSAPDTAVETLELEEYHAVEAVNIDGSFYLARAVLPYLRESEGLLVFVGSFAGKHPRPRNPVYAATKWWVRGFALSLAGQVGKDDVGITVVNPSEVRTAFGEEFREEGELLDERFEPGAVTEPEEVAAAIAFAARQKPPNVVTELDLYRRDKFEGF